MPNSEFPRDRFDDLPEDVGRVGAHRAEQPHMRGGVVFFWAALATVILIAVGIFAMFVVSGRIVLFPEPTPEPTPTVTLDPVVDTSYSVLILNATPETGLATQLKDQLIAAGWVPDTVLAGQAGTDDFPETTVYYATDADYAAALGLANVIGGAAVAQSDIYQPTDDPATEVDEGATKQLTIVIGLDRTAAGAPTPEPTA
ncbi:MAG: LytR C-terminal domain-containing protein [Microbacterium sp.]|uniref:LytR C-terminal domain-containing protein n=1 Tax=Microbacterium sp. TaxID=51671 RepID=UPI001821D6A7|nr:LytR family transcriptional regulator [Microbacterium sp.]